MQTWWRKAFPWLGGRNHVAPPARRPLWDLFPVEQKRDLANRVTAAPRKPPHALPWGRDQCELGGIQRETTECATTRRHHPVPFRRSRNRAGPECAGAFRPALTKTTRSLKSRESGAAGPGAPPRPAPPPPPRSHPPIPPRQ